MTSQTFYQSSQPAPTQSLTLQPSTYAENADRYMKKALDIWRDMPLEYRQYSMIYDIYKVSDSTLDKVTKLSCKIDKMTRCQSDIVARLSRVEENQAKIIALLQSR